MFNKYFIDLLFALTEKEIKARYKYAVLGFLWIFINPLAQMVVMGFVFSLVFNFGIKNYYLYLFAGLLPWNFFSLAINKATPRIVWDRNLIQKSKFPREVIPLSMVLSHFFHFIISWILFLVFLLLIKQWQFFSLVNLGSQLVAVFLLLIFSSGISLLTSSLTVFYRDINFITQMIIMLWFYITPIIYPISLIPDKFLKIFYLNPLVSIFCFFQKPIIDTFVPFSIILIHVFIVFVTFVFGWRVFRKKAKNFSDWL